jgi:uncharacterized membrane protein YccC
MAAIRAARATIVMPSLFVITDKLIGNPQMALFAAFGSFATLVLVTFGGRRGEKLIAHAGLALVGSALLIIGTAVSSSTALAAVVTVPVAFVVFFSGIAGPNAAAGVTGALLAYVLPAASAGTLSMVPDRLAGWWLASAAGTAAVLALPTPAAGDDLRRSLSNLARALAAEIEAVVTGRADEATLTACIEAKHELLGTFNATPFRPTGLAVSDQALSNAVELLQWCGSLTIDSARERDDLRDAPATARAVLEAAAAVLRQAAALFDGGDDWPELERLDAVRRQSTAKLRQLQPADDEFRAMAQLAFHVHAIAVTVLTLGADAVVAARLADARWIAEMRVRWFGANDRAPGAQDGLTAGANYARLVARNASVRSVWFVNSLRGAVAVAAAVAIADLSNVQNGFWVVLGTLSVLRTNAASTGATALRALLGTTVGFVIGGGLLLAIGTTSPALWIALPVAVFVAAYAPGTAPFAVGQAAFTVTVAVLFNLLVPVGWKVGVLRIEDVALGCLVSIAVGALLWPRGVAGVVGDDLADAYKSGASYLADAVGWACAWRPSEIPGARRAIAAGLRLDGALRGFVAEQGTKHIRPEQLYRLIGGSLRLRLTAHAVATLPAGASFEDEQSRAALVHRAQTLQAFYEQLASLVGPPRRRRAGALVVPAFDDGLEDRADSRRTVWLMEHLDHLTEHLGELVPPAERVAEIRRRPWWR